MEAAAAIPARPHRWTVRALLATATVLAILSIASVWAARQVLDAGNWADTSTKLLEDPAIRSQVAGYLVDEVYKNVDVSAELREALPPRLAPLAGPAAGGLRNLAEQTAVRALGRPRVQDAWRAANRATAEQLIAIAEGNSRAITTSGNAVILDVRVLLLDLVSRLGLSGRLADRLPEGAGRIKILSSDQVSTIQNGASLLRAMAIVLPVLSLALFALAVYLARGRRRRTLMLAGAGLIAAGLVVLVVRNVAGGRIVASLATTASVEPAVRAAYAIGTGMLRDVAQASIVIGIPLVLAAWLVGPARLAVGFRRTAAPWLRDRPDVTYGVAAVIVALVLLWGPIPATRQPIPVLLFIALAIAGVEALRRQTAREYPDVTADAVQTRVRERFGRASTVRRHTGNGSPAPDRIEQLERLASLHERGGLSDEEYGAEKAAVLGAREQPA